MVRTGVLLAIVITMFASAALAQGWAWPTNTSQTPPCFPCAVATGQQPNGQPGTPATNRPQGYTPLYLGLGFGYGDGTMPAPLDGTGFGSPWW